MTITYPLATARALALYTQRLHLPNAPAGPATGDDLYRVIEQIGCVQIDTLQMVRRSQYVALWSRLGMYDPADLDRLAFGDDGDDGRRNTRRLFEYWLHAASLIPLTEYRYRLPFMRQAGEGSSKWWQNWLSKPGNVQLLEAVRERVRAGGPLRGADFEHDGSKRSGWWDWKPAKVALERLYDQGELMIAGRDNFQRVYDLRERVLPEWVDTREPTVDEMHLHLLAWAAKALGVCEALQAADYVWTTRRSMAKPYLAQLMAEGTLAPVQVETASGEAREVMVHRDNLPLLQQAADGAIVPRRTTFLSPFDSLFWARGRDRQLWGFHQTLEAYKPAPQRIWGYFCLPILHHDRLVGRFDPKLERAAGRLRLKALYLEPGVKPDDELVAGVAAAMRDFLAFHAATELVIEHSRPAAFGKKLVAAM
jgi:uncharacterized protein YcaQ